MPGDVVMERHCVPSSMPWGGLLGAQAEATGSRAAQN